MTVHTPFYRELFVSALLVTARVDLLAGNESARLALDALNRLAKLYSTPNFTAIIQPLLG